MFAEHTLAVRGPSASGGRPTPEAAGLVLRHIGPLVHRAVSMGFRRPSSTRGRKPDWLRAAWDVRYVGISRSSDDATLLRFEAPRFDEAAQEVYRQEELFQLRPDGSNTGFDLLGDTLTDISQRVKDSERYDPGLLWRVEQFQSVIAGGVDSVTILGVGDGIPSIGAPVLDKEVAACARELYRQTPQSQRVRVAGKLDMIRDSDNVFMLVLDDGCRVRGVWNTGEMVSLSRFFGKYVLAEGIGIFRPSGAILRLDAEAMDMAADADHFFSKTPTPHAITPLAERVRQAQTPVKGASAIYGKWPGEESEEDLLASLEELRR